MFKENSEIFRIFQDKDNFSIIKNLLGPKDPVKLSAKTKLNEASVRKILKLLENAFVVKNQGESFVLTDIGIQTLRKIQGVEFFFSNTDYFLSHSLEEIPQTLLQRSEDFSKCEIVESIWPVSAKLVEIAKESKRFVNCVFSEPPFLLADPLYEKIHSGTKMKFLFGENSKLPDCNDLVDKLELNKSKISSLFEKRMCKKVIINLVVSDKGACLMLASKNDQLDIVNGIAGKDEKFIQWCNDFFDFKWNEGEQFARLRVENKVNKRN